MSDDIKRREYDKMNYETNRPGEQEQAGPSSGQAQASSSPSNTDFVDPGFN